MKSSLHIELYYAKNVAANPKAEALAIANVNEWLKNVADDIIKQGGSVHYEIGAGNQYRIFLENINDELAERAFSELDKAGARYRSI